MLALSSANQFHEFMPAKLSNLPRPRPRRSSIPLPSFLTRLQNIHKILGLLEGKNVGDIREQLDKDYKSTMLANWGVFVPAAVVNLAFCPPELRVLFLNVR